MGLCNRVTGICTCRTGFSGNACERQICPGGTPCNGVGKCQSMNYYAQNKNKGLGVLIYPPIGMDNLSNYPHILIFFVSYHFLPTCFLSLY